MRPNLTTYKAAELCGTTDEHIRKLARERRIPHYRVGSLYRFDVDELTAWLRGVHVPADEPEPAA